MENVFDSVDAIDAALDEEFGKETTEPETDENVENNDVNTESEDLTQGNNVEEGASNEEPNNEEGQVVETPVQNNGEGNKSSKKDYAFANLRSENTNLKKERDSYKADSDYLKELAASYGYDDTAKFQEAIKQARYQKEAQEKGYDPVLYKKTMEQEARIRQLEQEREKEIQDRKIERFQNALDNAVKEYNIDAQEIFNKLENSGLSVETVLSVDNPKILLDGLLVDEIRNNAKQSQIKDLQNLKNLAEDKNETDGQVNKVTIDSLLKEDMARYKKENFYE
ncbi:MAG: hypothetical protein MSA15_19985 [Clostridium sp.]|nr:hypothetical protein [Clostridium sp.]